MHQARSSTVTYTASDAREMSGSFKQCHDRRHCTLTKLGDNDRPALESTMEERGSCWKSVETTSSDVYLHVCT